MLTLTSRFFSGNNRANSDGRFASIVGCGCVLPKGKNCLIRVIRVIRAASREPQVLSVFPSVNFRLSRPRAHRSAGVLDTTGVSGALIMLPIFPVLFNWTINILLEICITFCSNIYVNLYHIWQREGAQVPPTLPRRPDRRDGRANRNADLMCGRGRSLYTRQLSHYQFISRLLQPPSPSPMLSCTLTCWGRQGLPRGRPALSPRRI